MVSYTDIKYVSIKFTRFYMKIVGFWLAKSEREQRLLYVALAYTIVAVVFAIGVEGVDLYYSWGDLNDVLYNACGTMPLIVIIVKVTVFTIRRDVVNDLIGFSETNFWKSADDDFSNQILKRCEKKGAILIFTLSLSVQATVCSYVITPMIENIGKNSTDRTLPFRLWIDFPITVSPYYEIIFVIESLSTIHSGICFFCFDNLMGILNIHVAGQFKILQHRLETLCDEHGTSEVFDENSTTKSERDCLNYNREKQYLDRSEKALNELKECVKQHLVLINYVEKLELLFSLILFWQVGVSSLIMCMGGFQLFVAKLTNIRRAIFVAHLMASTSELLLCTWTCNDIIVQSMQVADAAFRAKWYIMPNTKTGHSLRNALMMVMIRARHACYLSVGKFGPMSVETFTSTLSTTLSYFTLLRQMSEGT